MLPGRICICSLQIESQSVSARSVSAPGNDVEWIGCDVEGIGNYKGNSFKQEKLPLAF
jgi:hypothetical protein